MIKLKCNKNLLKNDKKVLTISKVYDIITAIKGKGVLNMWTETKSLALSRILACAATALIAALAFFVPYLSEWYEDISIGKGFFNGISIGVPMTVILYICEEFALAAMAALHILLFNISKDRVFVDSNTVCLRVISWACMLAGCAFFILGLLRFIFMTAAFFAVMLGLVIRVLKNVFEKAVELKSENDFTI